MIYITHDPARAAMADRVLRLENGKLTIMDRQAVNALAMPASPREITLAS